MNVAIKNGSHSSGSCVRGEFSDLGAWSKVILFGEHAAVYGHSALAQGLSGGMRVLRSTPSDHGIHLVIQPWGLDVTERADGQIGEALRRLLALVPGKPLGMELTLRSSVPPGAGLGSSACLSVSLVKCLSRMRNADMSLDGIRLAAHSLEQVFHGNPSGLDDTVATYGGMCLFRAVGMDEKAYPGACRLSPQCIQLPMGVPGLVIGDTGVKRSTAAMVESVKRLREKDPRKVNELFSGMDSCLQEGLSAIGQNDWPSLGSSLGEAHELLRRLDLSCVEIEEMLRLAMRAGALGGKLTGAGGGGAVVVLAPGAQRQVVEAWQKAGFFAWSAASEGYEGGRV